MSLKFYEALKSILYDVETFLSVTLKDVKLPKSAASEKDSILKKLFNLQEDFPQLKNDMAKPEPDRDLPSPVAKQPELRDKSKNTGDLQEIYDDIGPDNISESQDPYKPPSIASEGSEAVSEAIAASACISVKDAMSTCSHSGFLVRGSVGKSKMDIKQLLGGLFGGKKFCVVGSGVFYIFDKGNSKKPCGSFPLRGYEARMSADQSTKAKESFCFELVNPGQKSYVFAADSQEDMTKWINAVNAEALKVPDPRSTIICDDDSTGSDHDDVTTSGPSSAKLPLKKLGTAKAESVSSLMGEVYVDVEQTAADRLESDDDTYEDATTLDRRAIDEFDDQIYEEFNEISCQLPSVPATTPAATKAMTLSSAALSRAPLPLPAEATSAIPAKGEIDCENMFYGRWDCRAEDDNDLAFKQGDVILILSREYDRFGWWVGRLNGSVGLVPREYLTPAYQLVSG